jgi:hypothetical protein
MEELVARLAKGCIDASMDCDDNLPLGVAIAALALAYSKVIILAEMDPDRAVNIVFQAIHMQEDFYDNLTQVH